LALEVGQPKIRRLTNELGNVPLFSRDWDGLERSAYDGAQCAAQCYAITASVFQVPPRVARSLMRPPSRKRFPTGNGSRRK